MLYSIPDGVLNIVPLSIEGYGISYNIEEGIWGIVKDP